MNIGLFSSYYLAPIEYYYYHSKLDEICIDQYENFIKQSYRSRCYITGPNGVKSLSVPLLMVKRRKATINTRISNAENWQKTHWKSLEAGYRRSPYFEYYEHLFEPVYKKKFDFLLDFNMELHGIIDKALDSDIETNLSENYITELEGFQDYRTSFSPKNPATHLSFPAYSQVFEDRNPFAANLSIVDLLFNEGPNSSSYLKSIQIK